MKRLGGKRGQKMLEEHYQKTVASKVIDGRFGSAPLRNGVELPQRGRTANNLGI